MLNTRLKHLVMPLLLMALIFSVIPSASVTADQNESELGSDLEVTAKGLMPEAGEHKTFASKANVESAYKVDVAFVDWRNHYAAFFHGSNGYGQYYVGIDGEPSGYRSWHWHGANRNELLLDWTWLRFCGIYCYYRWTGGFHRASFHGRLHVPSSGGSSAECVSSVGLDDYILNSNELIDVGAGREAILLSDGSNDHIGENSHPLASFSQTDERQKNEARETELLTGCHAFQKLSFLLLQNESTNVFVGNYAYQYEKPSEAKSIAKIIESDIVKATGGEKLKLKTLQNGAQEAAIKITEPKNNQTTLWFVSARDKVVTLVLVDGTDEPAMAVFEQAVDVLQTK